MSVDEFILALENGDEKVIDQFHGFYKKEEIDKLKDVKIVKLLIKYEKHVSFSAINQLIHDRDWEALIFVIDHSFSWFLDEEIDFENIEHDNIMLLCLGLSLKSWSGLDITCRKGFRESATYIVKHSSLFNDIEFDTLEQLVCLIRFDDFLTYVNKIKHKFRNRVLAARITCFAIQNTIKMPRWNKLGALQDEYFYIDLAGFISNYLIPDLSKIIIDYL